MKKIVRYFHNLSLSGKMILVFSALLSAVCLIMLAALNISFGIYDQNLYEKSLQSLDFFAQQVDEDLEDVENFTYELAVSTELQQQLSDLRALSFGTSAYDYARYQLRVQLIQEARTHPIVQNIRFIDTNGGEMLVGTATGSLDTAPLLEELHAARGGYRLFSPTADYPYLVGGRDIRKHTDYSMDYLGSCLVTCDAASVIERQLRAMASSSGVMYVTAGDTMVYRGSEADPPAVEGAQGYRVWKQDGQAYFVCWMTDSATGWMYLNLFPYSQIFGQTMALRYILIGVFLALFLLGWLLLRWLARLITQPLERLSASMQVVESDNFEAALAMLPDHPYRDETGQLTDEFRVMLQQIDTLIRENYKKQLLLQETQYKMLQAQINPHFLNNTMNTVNWMIRAGRNNDAARVVVELGQLLRATLARESETSVAREVELVKSYIAIQEFRYHGRATFRVETEGALDRWTTPKMILQPLVENAIFHGVENSLTPCIISVTARERAQDILLEVHNTGPCMTPEELDAVRRFAVRPKGHGIGLKNIYDRLKLYFGSFGWEIDSGPEQGTRVRITLPKKEKDDV